MIKKYHIENALDLACVASGRANISFLDIIKDKFCRYNQGKRIVIILGWYSIART